MRADGARIDEHDRPCEFRDAERLVQLLIWSGVSLAYPEEEFARLRRFAEQAGDDASPQVRHARNATATARDVGIAQEMQAHTAAACAEFFTRHDVLVCPITPTATIPASKPHQAFDMNSAVPCANTCHHAGPTPMKCPAIPAATSTSDPHNSQSIFRPLGAQHEAV